ncbi:replication factor RFC1 C terminal domain-containing protein [Scheffersomyces amazonensis]|uniref:replication factor RFC1 C terminal domain-containing protein n=1 Tax=Scheffersomyces amazonensis TaxID=1078765 RepID=UPI00315D8192
MVRIDEFFNKASANKKTPSSKRKKPVEVIDIDDDIEEPVSKKRKEVEGEEAKVSSKYFPSKSPNKSKSKPKSISLDSEDNDYDDEFMDDDFDDDDLEIIEAAAKTARKPATPRKTVTKQPEPVSVPEPVPVPKVTPNKTSPKKASPKKEKTPPASYKPSGGLSAADILATIPDAHLPEDVEDKKFNFFAHAKATSSTGGNEPPIIPNAQENCLSGLTIVFTGVLPSLDRDTAENLAKKYGAKVTKSISSKTSLVVIGDEAGPSKVKKIKQFKIKAIDQDGFVKLLTEMPAEGGDSEAAFKAKLKREEEERKLMEQIKAEEDAELERKLIRQQELKLQQEKLTKQASTSNRLPREPIREIPDEEKLWTVKYAPTNISQLCGNKGQIQKLKNWLQNWFNNSKHNFKNPGPDGSGIFRACIISGAPGIGKTSTAHIIAKSLGFDILEKNASDVRSKSLLNSNLKEALNNTSVVGFFKSKDEGHHSEHGENDKKFCLIMDEVDGMSSGDNGGAGALSAFCRITKMPIILICNDRSLPKMRVFDRVTYDLPFRRPSEMEVKSRLMTIAHRENIKLDPTIIGQLVQATSNDIRQMINLLSTVSKTQKSIGSETAKDVSISWKKQTILKPFDIASRLLNGQIYLENSKHSLNDKIDLYFNDIDFTPLMIQENYLSTRPLGTNTSLQHLERVAIAADDISLSDQVNSLIRSSEQQWSLLPFHGVMSSVKPSSEVAGNVTQRMNFSSWLGQNSKTSKYQRLLQDIQYHTRLRTSTDKKELRLDYLSLLIKKLTIPLIDHQEEGIDEVIKIMDYYYLTKEDWDYIIDFGVGTDKSEIILKKIPTKVKSTFTRKYNAATHPIAIYKTGNSVGNGGVRKQKVDYEDVIEDDTAAKDEDEEGESQDGDKIDAKKDKLIKEVKPRAKAKPKKVTKKK